ASGPFEAALEQSGANRKKSKAREPSDAFLDECHAASDAAGEAARAEWDAWHSRACQVVDASSGWPDSPALPGLPGNPLASARKAVAASRPALREFSPRTASTPSTSALVRALAGPAGGFTPPPLRRSLR